MIKNLKNKKKKKAFTLIELIIVIAIIAILAAIALPKFGDVRKKANISADIANAKQIQSAVSVVIAEGSANLPGADTGFVLDNEADTTGGTISDIESKAIEQLQGAIPTIKTGDNKGNKFYVKVTDEGAISIFVEKDGVQIYPNGTGDYDQ